MLQPAPVVVILCTALYCGYVFSCSLSLSLHTCRELSLWGKAFNLFLIVLGVVG